jgi:putative flippase GtrA
VTRQFTLFLLAGAIAAAANVGSRLLFSMAFSLEVAVVLAYLVGMTVAFTLMRSQVFPPGRGSVRRQATLFAAVNVVAAAQTLIVTLLLARWLLPALGMHSHVEDLAHVIGVGVPIVTSYFGHKHWSFR